MYMPTKKKQHLKKSYKKKLHRRKRTRSYFFNGGSCASCGACMQTPSPSIFGGGKSYKNRSGGNDALPSYNGLPLRYVYPQNAYSQDPSDSGHTTNSRLLHSGGRTRRNNPKKGGSMSFSYLNGQLGSVGAFNPVSMVGESSGSSLHSNIISGAVSSNILQNPSVFSQPVDTKYNIYNRPIA